MKTVKLDSSAEGFSTRVTERVILPRHEGGVDWSAERILLARKVQGKKIVAQLFWRKSCKDWQDRMTGYDHEPGALVLQVQDSIGRLDFLGDRLHTGGRLSKVLLAKFTKELEGVFGPEAVAFLDPKRTVIAEG